MEDFPNTNVIVNHIQMKIISMCLPPFVEIPLLPRQSSFFAE